MKAKVAKAKILELDFRRKITAGCLLFAAQGGPGLGRWQISQNYHFILLLIASDAIEILEKT